MIHLPEETKVAVEQLRNGATVGMVDKILPEQGIGSSHRVEILETAKRIINRRARIKHLLIGGLGLSILAWGGYWFYLCVVNQNPRIRIPTVVMGVGLLVGIYGFYNSTQNKI